MTLSQIAIALAGLYIAVTSQTAVSSTLALIWGIVIIILVFLDTPHVRTVYRRPRQTP